MEDKQNIIDMFNDKNKVLMESKEQVFVDYNVWNIHNNIDAVIECLNKYGFIKTDEIIHNSANKEWIEHRYKLVMKEASYFCSISKVLVVFDMSFNRDESGRRFNICNLHNIQIAEDLEFIFKRIYQFRHFVKK